MFKSDVFFTIFGTGVQKYCVLLFFGAGEQKYCEMQSVRCWCSKVQCVRCCCSKVLCFTLFSMLVFKSTVFFYSRPKSQTKKVNFLTGFAVWSSKVLCFYSRAKSISSKVLASGFQKYCVFAVARNKKSISSKVLPCGFQKYCVFAVAQTKQVTFLEGFCVWFSKVLCFYSRAI